MVTVTKRQRGMVFFLSTIGSRTFPVRSSWLDLLRYIPQKSPHGPVFLFLDTCYAGGLADQTGQVLEASQPGLAVLCACQANESAFDPSDPSIKHGIFTNFLLDGLNGSAANDKGEISWLRLAAHVSDRVTSYTQSKGLTQNPGVLALHTISNIVIATSKKPTASLSRSSAVARIKRRSTTRSSVAHSVASY